MKALGINKKVWITKNRKTDGRYNQGKVVGIEKSNDCLYFVTKTEFFNNFELYRYKVAYIDCVTGKGCCEWLHHEHVTAIDPQ